MAKTSDDGLSVRLERDELRKVIESASRERGGFARVRCPSGAHQLGTDSVCPECSRYKASAVVRKG